MSQENPETTNLDRHAVTVLKDVADKIDASGPIVRERVVSLLVEREVATRTDVLDKALVKRTEIERELRKIKPDIEAFDVEGKVVRQDYSKARFEELKKKREELERIEKALDKALVDNDFSKLKEVVGSKLKEVVGK